MRKSRKNILSHDTKPPIFGSFKNHYNISILIYLHIECIELNVVYLLTKNNKWVSVPN